MVSVAEQAGLNPSYLVAKSWRQVFSRRGSFILVLLLMAITELEIDSGLCHCILTCWHYAVYMTNAIKIPAAYVIRLSRKQKQYSQVDDTDAGVMVSLDVVLVVVVSLDVISVDVVDVDVVDNDVVDVDVVVVDGYGQLREHFLIIVSVSVSCNRSLIKLIKFPCGN